MTQIYKLEEIYTTPICGIKVEYLGGSGKSSIF